MASDPRLTQLVEWIQQTLGASVPSLEPVSGDASFRRYFRYTSDKHRFIAVDAPPEKENNDAFINVTHLLEAEGLMVPHIEYFSPDFGFFLLSDFGDNLLLDKLDETNANTFYQSALQNLLVLQQTPATSLPDYDKTLLLQEMELFREWYLQKYLALELSTQERELLSQIFTVLTESALQQPKVFVHRDYHARNLMLMENDMMGIIDYQDAVLGPITYDLVSLLRDCYIAWDPTQVESWALGFYQQLVKQNMIENIEENRFIKWFDLMGIQRHLKAIGIFSRLNIRDGKPNYLQDIPRTMSYVTNISAKYPETRPLTEFICLKANL